MDLELLGALTTHYYTQSHTRGYARRLGHKYLHAQEEGMREEAREHGFIEEGTQFFTRGGHTAKENGLTYFSYLLSVHANCLIKCLIELLDRNA